MQTKDGLLAAIPQLASGGYTDAEYAQAFDIAEVYMPSAVSVTIHNYVAAHVLIATVHPLTSGTTAVQNIGNERLAGEGSMSRNYQYAMPEPGLDHWQAAYWTQTLYGQTARNMALALNATPVTYVGH